MAVLLFPQARRIGEARAVAAYWMGLLTERARTSYWACQQRDLRALLMRIGVSHDEADRQCQAFKDAVQHQIRLIEARTRANAAKRNDDPTGAA